MAGKPSHDATKNLDRDEPTQIAPKGTKIGLPTRQAVMAAFRKVAKVTPRKP
jgi:hypothetical protein